MRGEAAGLMRLHLLSGPAAPEAPRREACRRHGRGTKRPHRLRTENRLKTTITAEEPATALRGGGSVQAWEGNDIIHTAALDRPLERLHGSTEAPAGSSCSPLEQQSVAVATGRPLQGWPVIQTGRASGPHGLCLKWASTVETSRKSDVTLYFEGTSCFQ